MAPLDSSDSEIIQGQRSEVTEPNEHLDDFEKLCSFKWINQTDIS